MKKIGALWNHKDKHNQIFLAGTISSVDIPANTESISIMIFQNKYREERTRQPNWNVFLVTDGDYK